MKRGYFDNAATTYLKPPKLYEFVADYMQINGVNIGRGNSSAVQTAGAMLRETRDLLLKLVHADSSREVVFTPSATIALNTILFGLKISAGSTIYVTHFEHNAVLRVLYALQKDMDFRIEFLEAEAKTFTYDLQKIESQFFINPPSLIVMSQVSNVCGLIAPVSEIGRIAKGYGAMVVVDGAQACGVIDIDLSYIDYYVFAGHKTLMGPFGIGGFICRKNSNLKPLIYGGTGVDSANQEMPKTMPERFEAGSLNLMAIAGLNYSLKWILQIGRAQIEATEKSLLSRLKKILSKYDYISLIDVGDDVSAIVSCTFSGYTSDEMGRILSERGIAVRTGLHCAPEAHRFLQTFPEGAVRFSISYFTSDEDFTLLDKVLNELSDLL